MSAPDAPQVQIRSRAFDGALQFWWSAPVSDGGSPITGYVLSNGGSANWTWDLSGVETHFTVSDYDISGDGNAAIATMEWATTGSVRFSVDLSSVPTATIGIVPVGSSQFDPLDNSGYAFIVNGNSRVVTGTAPSDSFFTQYDEFQRVADTFSIVFDASYVKFYADNNLLHTSPRVSPELAYKVFLKPNYPFSGLRLGRDTVQLPAQGGTYRVPVLTNGTTYQYTLAATNAIDTGPTAAFRPTEPCLPPPPPTGVTATILGLGTVQVSWTNPVLDPNIYGHPRINIIRAFPSDMSTPILFCTYFNETSRVFQGLNTNLAYNFLVQAQSGAGNAPASAFSGPVSFGAGPADISGLALWLDAADSATLFSDLGATTPAVSGGPVNAWRDKSPTQKLYKAASQSYYATVTPPVWNAGSSVYFTAATDALGTDWQESGDYELFPTQESTIFLVSQISNDASFNNLPTTLFGKRDQTIQPSTRWTITPVNRNNKGNIEYYQQLSFIWGYPIDYNFGLNGNQVDMYTQKNCIVAYTDSSATTQYMLNGPCPALALTPTSRNEVTWPRFQGNPNNSLSGSKHWVLGDPSGNLVKDMRIYDIIAYNRKLSLTERQQVQNYLNVKYNIYVPDISNELFIRPVQSNNPSIFYTQDISFNLFVLRDASGSYTFNESTWTDLDASAVILRDSFQLTKRFTTPGTFQYRYTFTTHDNSGTGFTRDISCVVTKLPTDISGLRLWLDAQDTTTLFEDLSGTIPVTDNANAYIYRWNDKSGHNNHFTVQTYGGIPYAAPQWLFSPAHQVRFDASMQRISTDVNSLRCLTPSNAATIYLLAKVDTTPPGYEISPDQGIFRNVDASGNTTLKLTQGNGAIPDPTNFVSRIGHTEISVNPFNGDYAQNDISLLMVRADASSSFAYTVNPNTYELSAPRDMSGINLNAYYELGAVNYTRLQPLSIYQLFVYDGAHSEADRRSVLEYIVGYVKLSFTNNASAYPYDDGSIGLSLATDASQNVLVGDRVNFTATLQSAYNNTDFQFFKSQWTRDGSSNIIATMTHTVEGTQDASGTHTYTYKATTLKGTNVQATTGVIVDGIIESILGGQTLNPVSQLAVSSDATRYYNLSETNMRGVSGYFVWVYAVAWNGYMWLAGGVNSYTNANLIFSYDGVNWSPITPLVALVKTICWGNNRWVVGGNAIIVSMDGFNWNVATAASNLIGTINTIVWNGTVFLAGGETGGSAPNNLAYSTDGYTWVGLGVVGSIFAEWRGLLWVSPNWYGVGVYSGSPGHLIAKTSAVDGSGGWTFIQNPAEYPAPARSIDYNGTTFMIAGENYIATSTDATNWTFSYPGVMAPAQGESFAAVKWLGNRWMLVGGANQYNTSTATIATSQDNGVTWVSQGKNVYDAAGLAIGPRALETPQVTLVAGGATSGSPGTLAVTGDGTRWKSLGATIFTGACYGVAYNDGVWVAVGDGTNTIARSTDGLNWVGLGTSIFSSAAYNVAWKAGVWVAVGFGTNAIASSTDGSGWTGHGTSIFTRANGVAANHAYFVVVGATDASNSIASSPDGVNWTGHGLGVFSTAGYAIAAGLNNFVAVGEGTNSIAWSTDLSGTNWTGDGTTTFSVRGTGLATDGRKWVLCGAGTNTLATATMNMGTITGRGSSVFSASGWKTAYGNGRWVATGVSYGSPTVVHSLDGITWRAPLGTQPFGNEAYALGFAQPTMTFGGNNSLWIGYSFGQAAAAPAFQYQKTTYGQRRKSRWAGSYWLSPGQNPPLLYSFNGVNWVEPVQKNANNLPSVFSATVAKRIGTTLYVAGDSWSNNYCVYYTDPDLTWPAAAWTLATDYIENGFNATGLSHDPSSNVLVLTGYTGTNKLYRGTVGNSAWSLVDPGGMSAYWQTIFADNKFWVVGSDAPYIRWSADGTTWNDVSGGDLSGSGGFGDIAYNGSTYVVVGRLGDNDIFYSTDGVVWRVSQRAGPVYNIFGTALNSSAYSVVWDGARFVASGQDTGPATAVYKFATSPDGITWTIVPNSATALTNYTGIATLGSRYTI